MGQIQLTISVILISLFTIAIIGFAVNFGNDNSAPVNLANDPELSSLYTRTEGNMSEFAKKSEDSYDSIIESSIDPGGQTTASGGAFALTPWTLLAAITNIFKVGYIKIFGTGSGFGIFFTTFFGVLVGVMALFVWKTWAGRSPD